MLNNLSLKKVISKFHCEMSTLKDYDYNLYKFLMNDWRFKSSNWDNISTRYYLSWWLGVFLKNNGIEYTPLMKYEQEYNFLLDIQPTWLNIDDDIIFQKILDEIPQNLSKTQRIKIGKEKIKELFRYDKTYPRWVQNPEWPIVNGKPLVFSHQEQMLNDNFHTYYCFYDEDTKKRNGDRAIFIKNSSFKVKYKH